jgi:uncharacterized sulfatase
MKSRLILAGLLACGSVYAADPSVKPFDKTQGGLNVVFIMLDDLGYSQVEPYARGLTPADCDPALLAHVKENSDYTPEQAFELVKIATPTLSRMADEGVRFNNAFACSNLCAPSRIGVATGILQNRWGIYRNIDTEAHGLNPHSHLAERVKAQGYATAHIGKWHIGTRDPNLHWASGSVLPKDNPLNNGFDYYFGYNMWESPYYNATNVWENFEHAGKVTGYNTDVFTDKALNFMEESIAAGKPFYVQLHYQAVHGPLWPRAPEKYFSRFTTDSTTLNKFYAHVFAVDENVRRIEDFLKEKGQNENTLYIFTSDNGGTPGGPSALPGNAPFSGHKGMMNLGGFRVPLFFYWPGKIHEPLVKDQLVSTLDILPTVVDAVGGTLPDGLDGKSLLPQILNNSEEPVRPYFAVAGIHSRMWAFHSQSLLIDKYKARELEPAGFDVVNDRYILRYVGKAPSGLYKDAPDGVGSYFALYDYTKDPLEQNNIIKQYPEVAKELKQIWAKESQNFPKPVAWDVEKWEEIMTPEESGQ